MNSCEHCHKPLPADDGPKVGRPQKYCTTTCRQAAHRARRNGTRPPDPRLTPAAPMAPPNTAPPPRATPGSLEEVLNEVAKDLQDDGRQLLRHLHSADPEQALQQILQMRTRLDCLTAGLVGQARLHRFTWNHIGKILSISEDTARHRYTDDYILRRLHQVSGTISAPTSLRALYTSTPQKAQNTSADTATQDELTQPVSPPPTPAHNRLAPVLSMLARASRLTSQGIAHRVGCSPSYLSRILSGERVPSWKITERFAKVCGADPAVLRKVWETEQLRSKAPREPVDEPHDTNPLAGIRTKEQATLRLLTALRTLHVRAGQPTPHEICVAAKWKVRPQQITAILEGTEPCDWDTLVILLRVLGGPYNYFEPLWKAANQQDMTTAPDDADPSPRPGGGAGARPVSV